MIAEVSQYVAVASFTEAWIEIDAAYVANRGGYTSPPSRRRGLKSFRYFPMFPPLRRLLHGGVD